MRLRAVCLARASGMGPLGLAPTGGRKQGRGGKGRRCGVAVTEVGGGGMAVEGKGEEGAVADGQARAGCSGLVSGLGGRQVAWALARGACAQCSARVCRSNHARLGKRPPPRPSAPAPTFTKAGPPRRTSKLPAFRGVEQDIDGELLSRKGYRSCAVRP